MPYGSRFHSNFEFSQTFTSVTITLWKHRENVFYCFYEIKARSDFLCFHRVVVNGFEPISARVVSCLFHKCCALFNLKLIENGLCITGRRLLKIGARLFYFIYLQLPVCG